MDTDRWVSFMLAELASREGDYAEAARCCEAVLAAIAPNPARWWQSLRAIVKARLAVVVLKQGEAEQCVRLLTESLDYAASWWEHPALATVLEACAVYAQHPGAPHPDSQDDVSGASENRATAARAAWAARLLGAAHTIRGAFDESSLDAPPSRAQAREVLGPEAFTVAYESALSSTTYESAIALARELLPAVPPAGRSG